MEHVLVGGQRAGKATLAIMERAMARHQESKAGHVPLVEDRSWALPNVPDMYKASLRLVAADMGKDFHLNVDYSKLNRSTISLAVAGVCQFFGQRYNHQRRQEFQVS